jgi:hypothetical protein
MAVGAVCPNCHREIHSGVDGDENNERLKQDLAVPAEAYSTEPPLRRLPEGHSSARPAPGGPACRGYSGPMLPSSSTRLPSTPASPGTPSASNRPAPTTAGALLFKDAARRPPGGRFSSDQGDAVGPAATTRPGGTPDRPLSALRHNALRAPHARLSAGSLFSHVAAPSALDYSAHTANSLSQREISRNVRFHLAQRNGRHPNQLLTITCARSLGKHATRNPIYGQG